MLLINESYYLSITVIGMELTKATAEELKIELQKRMEEQKKKEIDDNMKNINKLHLKGKIIDIMVEPVGGLFSGVEKEFRVVIYR